MTRIFLLIAMLGIATAHAADGPKESNYNYFPLVVETTKPDNTHWTSFIMRECACLRGPLQFIDADGKVVFDLAKDVEYPTGCGNGVSHLRN